MKKKLEIARLFTWDWQQSYELWTPALVIRPVKKKKEKSQLGAIPQPEKQ